MINNIRLAQVGCGYWGRNLVRNFAELGVLAAVVDGNSDTAATMARNHGAVARDLDDVFGDPDIQGVSLATPAETHAELALRAFKAGKHVFVEKPLALTSADGRRMIEAAAAADRNLMVGHLLRYHPVFRACLQMVQDGVIGPLRYVYSNRLSLGKLRTEEDVLWSFAPHDLSMILTLAGGSAVAAVSAQGASFVTPGLDDVSMLQLTFANGLRGHVLTSWIHPFKEHRLIMIGEAGMLVFEDSRSDWDQKLALYRHRVEHDGPSPVPVPAAVEYIAIPRGEPLRNECEEFVLSIREGRAPLTDGAEGLRVLEVLEAAARAASQIGTG